MKIQQLGKMIVEIGKNKVYPWLAVRSQTQFKVFLLYVCPPHPSAQGASTKIPIHHVIQQNKNVIFFVKIFSNNLWWQILIYLDKKKKNSLKIHYQF